MTPSFSILLIRNEIVVPAETWHCLAICLDDNLALIVNAFKILMSLSSRHISFTYSVQLSNKYVIYLTFAFVFGNKVFIFIKLSLFAVKLLMT